MSRNKSLVVLVCDQTILKGVKAIRALLWIYNFDKVIVLIDQVFVMKEIKENGQITFVQILKIILYVLVMFVLGLVLSLLCLKSILKYNEWPIYTETNIVNQNQARVPAMTFCSLSNGYKEDILRVI